MQKPLTFCSRMSTLFCYMASFHLRFMSAMLNCFPNWSASPMPGTTDPSHSLRSHQGVQLIVRRRAQRVMPRSQCGATPREQCLGRLFTAHTCKLSCGHVTSQCKPMRSQGSVSETARARSPEVLLELSATKP